MSRGHKTGRWKLPPGVACGGGVLTSGGLATYAGYLPVAVAITGGAIIAVFMLLATLAASVMPQRSEHRNESFQALLEHRRKMEVLKQKDRARAESAQAITVTVHVIPTPRPAPNLSSRAPRPHRNGTLSG